MEECLGYSPAQASERVSATRLLRQIPEVAEALTAGSHTLTSIAKIASHARRESLGPAKASDLIHATSNQSILNLEKHLAGVAKVEPPRLERSKVISKETTRLTLDVDDAFMATITRMRELRGNPALPLSEVFAAAMEEYVARRAPKEKIKEGRNEYLEGKNSGTSVTEGVFTLKPTPIIRSRYIRAVDRRAVSVNDEAGCAFVHRSSGRRCSSRVGLQFEHITPFARGGENVAENLRRYCPQHNRFRAIEVYGEKKMRPFLKL